MIDARKAPVPIERLATDLRTLRRWLDNYAACPRTWPTKKTEWVGVLARYERGLRIAAGMLDVPVPATRSWLSNEDRAGIENRLTAAGFCVRPVQEEA